jgi:hypothetical protein
MANLQGNWDIFIAVAVITTAGIAGVNILAALAGLAIHFFERKKDK